MPINISVNEFKNIYFLFPLGYYEDSTSLASQMTSTDSGIWSENGTTPIKGQKVTGVDVNCNGIGVKGHYREDSFGGSSGFGSLSSHNGGARPKLNTQIPDSAAAAPKVGCFFSLQ